MAKSPREPSDNEPMYSLKHTKTRHPNNLPSPGKGVITGRIRSVHNPLHRSVDSDHVGDRNDVDNNDHSIKHDIYAMTCRFLPVQKVQKIRKSVEE